MKKILIFPIALLVIFCISCNNGPGLSATAKKNLDAMHGVTQCFDTKDFSKLGDYIAEDAVDHAGQNGDIKGLANMKAEFEKMVADNETSKTEVIKELADDEYVMSWLHFTGTMKNAAMGYSAGEKYDMKVIELAKFKDGKAIEHWSFMEPNDMKAMMSKMQPATMAPPPPPVKIDTVKKK